MTILLRMLSSPWNCNASNIISMACLLFLLLAISYILASNATGIQDMNLTVCIYVNVCSTGTLVSSADSVCPGDTVVFTCATDTGELIWSIGDLMMFFNNISESNHSKLSIYDFKLISKNGMNFISTTTIDNVHLDFNGTAILCGDNGVPQISNTAMETVIVAGNNTCRTKLILFYCAGPPTAPLNLRFCFDLFLSPSAG